jgi:hypothetical protein
MSAQQSKLHASLDAPGRAVQSNQHHNLPSSHQVSVLWKCRHLQADLPRLLGPGRCLLASLLLEYDRP